MMTCRASSRRRRRARAAVAPAPAGPARQRRAPRAAPRARAQARSPIAPTTTSRSTTSRARRRSRRACSITTSRPSAISTSPACARSPTSSSSAVTRSPTTSRRSSACAPARRLPRSHHAARARVRLAHARRHRLAIPRSPRSIEGVRTRLFDQFLDRLAVRAAARAATSRFETAVRGWIGFVEARVDRLVREPAADARRAPRAARRDPVRDHGRRRAADSESRHRTVSRAVVIVDRFAPEAEAAARDVRRAVRRAAQHARRSVRVGLVARARPVHGAAHAGVDVLLRARCTTRFHRRLVAWGRETLGCHDISPPWLSLYVDGCRQELHGDLPHGPWAFVFSLTRWRGRVFRGGETLLVRDEVLDFWHDFRSVRGVEERRADPRDRAALRSARPCSIRASRTACAR